MNAPQRSSVLPWQSRLHRPPDGVRAEPMGPVNVVFDDVLFWAASGAKTARRHAADDCQGPLTPGHAQPQHKQSP